MQQDTEIKAAVQPEAAQDTQPKPETANENTAEQKAETKTVQPKVHRSFTSHDVVFAWLAYLSGYLFCRNFPLSESALGSTLFTVFIFLVTGVIMVLKKVNFSGTAVFSAVSAVALSAAYVVSSDWVIHFFASVYGFAAYCYFVYTATGNSLGKPFSSLMIFDTVKAVFFMPFGSFKDFELFRAIFGSRTKKSAKLIIGLAVGIVIAIVPASLALSLLSYDEGFKEIVNKIFNFENIDIGSHALSLLFAVPIAMYIFSLYLSCADKKESKRLNKANFIKATEKIKIAPAVTVLAAVIPLLAVYVIFFISQRQYYISGFTGVLPENFSYAQYAREGFFELCKVSVINLTVIVLIMLMMKKGKANSVIIKVLTVVFSAVTLALISTAVSKLVMYISRYGLTQKRVYAAWFMAVLAVIFLVVTLSRFIRKIQWVPVCAAVVVVAFAGLALCNADSLIAKYNVDSYINGSLENVDIDALTELGDAAIPEMARLIQHLDKENGTDVADHSHLYYASFNDLYSRTAYELSWRATYIYENHKEGIDTSVFSYTLNRARAEKALTELGLLKAE